MWMYLGSGRAHANGALIPPAQATHGGPALCSRCGSVLDSLYDNMVITSTLAPQLTPLYEIPIVSQRCIYMRNHCKSPT